MSVSFRLKVRRVLAHGMAGACLILASAVSDASADTISIATHPLDYEARFTAAGVKEAAAENTGTLRIGGTANSFDFANVFFFRMPDLPANHVVTAANFFSIVSPDSATDSANINFNVDLVALGFETTAGSPTLVADFAYIGQGADDTAAGVGGPGVERRLIQDNYLTPADHRGTAHNSLPTDDPNRIKEMNTSAAGQEVLANYINTLYANSAFDPGVSYLILRLNPDYTSLNHDGGVHRRFVIASENNTVRTPPTLTLETAVQAVPEPSSLALAGIGVIGVAITALRRRRKSVA